MNRSNTTPRSYTTDQLHTALDRVGGPARPDYLPDIVAQASRIRQRPAWTFLERWLSSDIAVPRQGVPRRAVLLAVLLLLIALFAASVLYVGSQLIRPRPPSLPATPGAWERVLIELPSGHMGSVVSLAASPRGLLAVVGEGMPYGNEYLDEARLAVSTDGRSWTLVPDGQHPLLSNTRSFGYPSVVGTDRGFLMVQLNEVWISEYGSDWRRLAGETTDPDLDMGGPGAATTGGPGLVAVGGAKAWHAMDGSDWSVAVVPALPAEILARPESDRYVGMRGVTAAGNHLVAWGIAEVPMADNSAEHLVMPLLWASGDGRTWTDVVDPLMSSVNAVAGGPDGFVAAGQAAGEAALWFSADGEAWERANVDGFTPVELVLKSAAATSAGYVVVGAESQCLRAPCPDQEAAVLTSLDGRSWSRVASDDRFARARADLATAWGARFVVGGAHEGQPVIWISE